MMTEEHIKEAISLRYIELIAASNGYITSSSYPDYGTDLNVIEVGYRIENEHKRYSNTGRELKFQLKATAANSVIDETEIVKYDLDAKAYNDLIEIKDTPYPLFLVLFIFPTDDNKDWISISDNELIARKCAYWYFPEDNDVATKNSTKKRIIIGKKNLFELYTLNQLFENF